MAVRYKLTKINDNITGKEQVKYSVTRSEERRVGKEC